MTNYNEVYVQMNDAYISINGEGISQGQPALYLLFQGCSLKCKHCTRRDFQHPDRGVKHSVHSLVTDNIIPTLLKYDGVRRIIFTGGDPTEQPNLENLIKYLIANFYKHQNLDRTKLHLEHKGIIKSSRGTDDYSVELNKLRMFTSVQFALKTPTMYKHGKESFLKSTFSLAQGLEDFNKNRKRDVSYKFIITCNEDIDHYLKVINRIPQIKLTPITIQPYFDVRNKLNTNIIKLMDRVHDLIINNRFGTSAKINVNINKVLCYPVKQSYKLNTSTKE